MPTGRQAVVSSVGELVSALVDLCRQGPLEGDRVATLKPVAFAVRGALGESR